MKRGHWLRFIHSQLGLCGEAYCHLGPALILATVAQARHPTIICDAHIMAVGNIAHLSIGPNGRL